LARLFASVAPPAEAERVAARITGRVRGTGVAAANARAEARDGERRRDSLTALLLGRPARPGFAPFESLDDLQRFVGSDAPWLAQLAPLLTVDGDGTVDRRHADPRVRRAASGSLTDAPTRVLVISRGWQAAALLTREIQAVYAIEGNELRLVTWREQHR
jgi:type II secretory pathway component PulK